MTERFLDRRQRAIHQYRCAGKLVDAERYGWLSLASLWIGLGSQAAIRQDPARQIDFSDILITAPGQERIGTSVSVPGTELTATDPRDPFGTWIADLAADAATRAVVTNDGVPMASAIVADALSQILAVP